MNVKPKNLRLERPRVHECAAVEVEAANDQRVHYNHHNASSFAVADLSHLRCGCFSFYLDSLARRRVLRVEPEKFQCIFRENLSIYPFKIGDEFNRHEFSNTC